MASFAAVDAIFIPDGATFAPTGLARGPWDPNAQHGGAAAALIGRALERMGGDGWRFARIDVQFVKPVPLRPVEVEVEVEREGRRARRLRAVLKANGNVVSIADALQLRPGAKPVPAVEPNARKLAPPYAGSEALGPFTGPMFFGDGVDVQIVKGAFDTPGPAAGWFRLKVPLVAGEEPSPIQRTLAAADFGNGLSSAIPWTQYVFINAELTVYLLRYPEGEWVALDSRTSIDPDGVGLTDSTLHDEQGPIGRAMQALYVSTR